jgi:hypothetical protein
MKVVMLGTALLRKRSILLMKSGEVKTQKQNFLFFIRSPLLLSSAGILLAHPADPVFFISALLDTC